MSDDSRRAFTRRSFLVSAALGSGAVLGGLGLGDAAVAAPHGPALDPTAELARHGLMDAAGLRAEYRAAIATFPFDLPEGYQFPSESRAEGLTEGGTWEVGAGRAEAYCFWQSSMVAAAYDADLAGHDTKAEKILDALKAGYESETRRAVLEDPANYFVDEVLVAAAADTGETSEAAKSDFEPLVTFAGVAA